MFCFKFYYQAIMEKILDWQSGGLGSNSERLLSKSVMLGHSGLIGKKFKFG